MLEAFSGFALLLALVVVGYLTALGGVLPAGSERGLARLAFVVLTPALLFGVVSDADLSRVVSPLVPIAAIAAAFCFGLYALIARFGLRRSWGEVVVGGLASSYVNVSFIGVPLALYVLGDASAALPALIVQVLVLGPVGVTLLALATGEHVSVARVVLAPARNPILIGAAAGAVVSLAHLELPTAVLAPVHALGAAAIPIVLLAFGASFHGTRPLAAGAPRADIALATGLKVIVMPLVAWALAALWQLDARDQLAAVLFAALPAGQNVFTFAQNFLVGTRLARDATLISTVLSIVPLGAIVALTVRVG